MNGKLEICPFCKISSDMIGVHHYYDETYQIECSACGARGDYHSSREEAVKRWNEISYAVMEYDLK